MAVTSVDLASILDTPSTSNNAAGSAAPAINGAPFGDRLQDGLAHAGIPVPVAEPIVDLNELVDAAVADGGVVTDDETAPDETSLDSARTAAVEAMIAAGAAAAQKSGAPTEAAPTGNAATDPSQMAAVALSARAVVRITNRGSSTDEASSSDSTSSTPEDGSIDAPTTASGDTAGAATASEVTAGDMETAQTDGSGAGAATASVTAQSTSAGSGEAQADAPSSPVATAGQDPTSGRTGTAAIGGTAETGRHTRNKLAADGAPVLGIGPADDDAVRAAATDEAGSSPTAAAASTTKRGAKTQDTPSAATSAGDGRSAVSGDRIAPAPRSSGQTSVTAPSSPGSGMFHADKVRYLRDLAPAREIQRLAIDLDDARVAVRFNGSAPTVDVMSDPSSRLDAGWARSVEKTLRQLDQPVDAGSSGNRQDDAHQGNDGRSRGQSQQRQRHDELDDAAVRRWQDATRGLLTNDGAN